MVVVARVDGRGHGIDFDGDVGLVSLDARRL